MSEHLDFAIETARIAGDTIIRLWKGEGIGYTNRSQAKAEADKISDDLIRQRIAEAYPHHGIMSEENTDLAGNEYTWVFDPIDGTQRFVAGEREWGVAISLAKYLQVFLGVIYRPVLDEIIHAEIGSGAYINSRRVEAPVNATKANESIIGADFGLYPDNRRTLTLLDKLYQHDGVVYTPSIACATAFMIDVVKGKLDGYVSASLSPWDMAACAVICKEANLRVTDVEGNEWKINSGSILVANEELHEDLLRLIRAC